MHARINNILHFGYRGIFSGYMIGQSIYFVFAQSLQNEFVTYSSHLDELSLNPYSSTSLYNDELFCRQNVNYPIFENPIVWNQMLSLSCAFIGGVTGVVWGSFWPSVEEFLENSSDPAPSHAAPLVLPENTLQKELNDSGYKGNVPSCFLDPVLKEIMDDPYILQTVRCSSPPYTARTYNLSTIQTLEKYNNKLCPMTRESFTSYIPNVELKQAIHEWVATIKEKMKKKTLLSTEETPSKKTTDEINIPSYYLDPETKKLMDDPCILLTEHGSPTFAGKSYNRSTIQEWEKTCKKQLHYIPNRELKDAIEQWTVKIKKHASLAAMERFGVFSKNIPNQNASPPNNQLVLKNYDKKY